MRISSVSGVSHQGCGGGGGVSFEMSYSDPAKRTGVERMTVANTALARRCNFVFTSRSLPWPTPKSEKNKLSISRICLTGSVFLVLLVGIDLSAIRRCLVRCVYRTFGL